MLRYYHYCGAPVSWKLDGTFIYQESHKLIPKPDGLWFSVEGYTEEQGWSEYCRAEGFRTNNLKFKYLISISPKANLIEIHDEEAFYAFEKQYVSEGIPRVKVAWETIRAEYDGIVISPFFDQFYLSSIGNWYYGWDCASGCVWNVDVIESITLDTNYKIGD